MTTSQVQQPTLDLPRAQTARRRPLLFLFKLLLFLVVAGGLAVLGVMGFDKGRAMLAAGAAGPDLVTYTVAPMDLRVTVTEPGTTESASSEEVNSLVLGRVAIISLVPEGTRVKKGDVVVDLDTSSLKTHRTQQAIVVNTTRAELSQATQAENDAKLQAESDLANAELAVEFARLDLTKYMDGDYPQEQRILAAEITLAEEELKRAEQREADSKSLYEEGYLSQGEYDADRLSRLRAEVKLQLARTKDTLLRDYTHERQRRNLESKVTEAERTQKRVEARAESTVAQAGTTREARAATLALEEKQLADIDDQILKCTMRAPQDGVVVYPAPADDDMVELIIKQGTVIREQQHVFSISATDIMQVSTSVHEAVVDRVKKGLPTRVWVDVYPDLQMKGEVTWVSPLPEPEDWRKATVKFYETHVKLLDQTEEFRPGMSTKVEILIDKAENVLAVPVQAVIQQGRKGVCYVMENGRPALRRITLGRTNDQYIEVVDGVAAGDEVVLAIDIVGVAESIIQDLESDDADPDDPEFVPAPEPGGEDEGEEIGWETTLLGTGDLVGEADYEVTTYKDGRVERKFQVELTGGAPGDTFAVTVNGVHIGEVTLDSTGYIKHKWKTEKETFPENFPDGVGEGTRVTVGDMEATLELD